MVKAVSHEESPRYSVQLLKAGGEYGPAVSVCWNNRLTEFVELFYYIAVIRNRNRTILVNTGMPADFSAFENFVKAWHPSCRLFREPGEETANALLSAGIDPAQVDTVVLTPLTVYTTGNLKLFPNAKFAVNRRGWVDFWAPEPSAPRLPLDISMARESRVYLAEEALPRVVLLDDEDSVCPGVDVFYTGGHHASSMAIAVATDKGKVILGDCFFTYANLEKNIPIGWAENMHEIYRAYARIRKEADIAVPLYDPEVLRRFPDGRIAMLEND